MPKIDILLATFNAEKYLRPLADSLLAQSFSDWRVIAHDDGSSDATLQILRSYSGRFPAQFMLLEDTSPKGGASQNFSYLAQHSTSDYVMFCDQDDVWLPMKISDAYRKIVSMEESYGARIPLLVHTDMRVVSERLDLLGESFWEYQNLDPDLSHSFNALLMGNVVTGCTVLVNRALIRSALPVPVEAVMHDWWFALVAAAFGRIEYLPCPSLLYRQHSDNSVGAKRWGTGYVARKLLNFFDTKELIASLRRSVLQARVFRSRYGHELSPEKRQALDEYVRILEMGWIERRAALLRHGFRKSGLIRNLGLFARI